MWNKDVVSTESNYANDDTRIRREFLLPAGKPFNGQRTWVNSEDAKTRRQQG